MTPFLPAMSALLLMLTLPVMSALLLMLTLPVMSALLLMLTLPVMSALVVGKFVLPMLSGTVSAVVLEWVFMLVLAVLELAFLSAMPILLVTAVAKAHEAPCPAKSR